MNTSELVLKVASAHDLNTKNRSKGISRNKCFLVMFMYYIPSSDAHLAISMTSHAPMY